jgi:hypothetical protein
MSYIYLQEQGEESSVDNFKDIPAYVLSRLNLTQDKSCCNGSETESCQNSRYGMISEHSMEHLGEEKSTSFAEDFLAKTFPQLEKELESRANALGFGEKWPGWLAKYDQDLCLWKTPQCSLLEDYIEYSETWPKWGMMQDGVCWELTTSVRHIEERESGYWPTPNTLEGLKPKTIESIQEYNQKARPGRSYCNMNLREIVVYGKQPIRPIRMIPTPTCSDAFTSNLKSTQQKPDTMHSVSLAQLCEKMPEKMWPTPTSQEAGLIPLETIDGEPPKPGQRAYNPKTGKHTQVTLNRAVNLWPTPDANMGARGTQPEWKPVRESGQPAQYTINQAVRDLHGGKSTRRNYSTPTATMKERSKKFLEGADRVPNPAEVTRKESGQTGQLNPDWVEWLMGWPIGWTKTEPIELDWRDWSIDPADNNEIPRVSQSIANRVSRLKAIGNGQVPAVAAVAWDILTEGLL